MPAVKMHLMLILLILTSENVPLGGSFWHNLNLFFSNLGSTHPTFGSIPWAQQFGECGQQGSKLHVPFTFFDNLRGNLRRKCNVLQYYKPVTFFVRIRPKISLVLDLIFPNLLMKMHHVFRQLERKSQTEM